MNILEDITSKDPHRIWSSAHRIIKLRDSQELSLLVGHLDAIKQSTRDMPLGGLLRSNSVDLNFAIQKLERVKSGLRCLCDLYPLSDRYNPADEEEAGNVTILCQNSNAETWSSVFECQCCVCNVRYRVEEELGGHYPFWSWQRA